MSKSKRTLHIVGQAHLDPVWLWPWNDGVSEVLTTMGSAVDRMRETPGFCFSRSSAITYRWVREADPRLWAEIKRLARQGRWEAVNGWIVQPDCNVPSAESFVRQALYGKGYLREHLGVDVTVGYNVDSFGHAAGLPQLLARAGYRYYVFTRPAEGQLDLPTLFWWEGPDGSRVLAWRIPGSYCQSYSATPDDLEAAIRTAAVDNFAPGFEDGLFFLGVGNHGGGPTRQQIARVLELRHDPSLPRLEFSTLGRFFASVESSPGAADLPVVRRGLQHVFTGCYSAHSEIKALNRRAEKQLTHGEAIASLALVAGHKAYPAQELREAWWKLLFNQFHDILSGTSIQPAYADARDSMGRACDTGRSTAVTGAHQLARQVDTSRVQESCLCLVNPLPWPRRTIVEIDTFAAPHGERITHLATHQGRKLPLQWGVPHACFGPHMQPWGQLSAVVDVPAGGYRVLELAHGPGPERSVKPRPLIRVSPSKFGIASLKAPDGRELLTRPIGLVAIRDKSSTWGHDVYAYRDELGRPTLIETTRVEDGPVRRVVRQHARWRRSEILLDIVTWHGLDAIELRVRVDWQQKHEMLKLEIPTRLTGPRVVAQVAGAVETHAPDGREQPGQDWVAVEGKIRGAAYSVGLVNDSTYSYDCLDGCLRTVVVRSAFYAQHPPAWPAKDFHNPHHDQGWTEKRFWLLRVKGRWTRLDLARRSLELQTPAEYAVDSAHAGAEPWEQSLLAVDGRGFTVLALKQAEDGKGLVLRVQETRGRQALATLKIPSLGVERSVALSPWEIQTLRIRPGRGTAKIVAADLLER
jgi:alpha-mannosidase